MNNTAVIPLLEKVKASSVRADQLRLGTGEEPGFLKLAGTAVPWSWPETDELVPENSISKIMFSWYFHRLGKGARWLVMNEAYRVLKPFGQLLIVVPYWSSRRAVADPLAEWPPVCEDSFSVYSKTFREKEDFTQLPLTCDFATMTPDGQLTIPSGHVADPWVQDRNDDYRTMASKHFINTVWELHVTLTKAI